MKLSDTEYHQGNGFRGYSFVSQEIFDQVTPFLMRDHDKMISLLRDVQTVPTLPAWFDKDVESHEWNGYIIVVTQEQPKPAEAT